MGFTRTSDEVPGYEIPWLYFDYLRTGDARPLGGVFYHNAMDVVAMAALLAHVEAACYGRSRHLFLCVSSFNPRARQFYARHGFETVGTLKAFLSDGADEILMHKRLAAPPVRD